MQLLILLLLFFSFLISYFSFFCFGQGRSLAPTVFAFLLGNGTTRASFPTLCICFFFCLWTDRVVRPYNNNFKYLYYTCTFSFCSLNSVNSSFIPFSDISAFVFLNTATIEPKNIFISSHKLILSTYSKS